MSEVDKIDRFIEGLHWSIRNKVAFEEPMTLSDAKTLSQRMNIYFNKSNNQPKYPKNPEKSNKEPHQEYKPKKEPNLCRHCGVEWFKGHRCLNNGNNSKPNHSADQKQQPHHNNKDNNKNNNQETEPHRANLGIDGEEWDNQANILYKKERINRDNMLQVRAKVDGIELNCILDTGATTSIISNKTVLKLGLEVYQDVVMIKLANGSLAKGYRTKPVPLAIKDRDSEQSFIVMPLDDIDVIIGLDWCRKNVAAINLINNTIVLKSDDFKLHEGMFGENEIECLLLAEIDEEELQEFSGWNET